MSERKAGQSGQSTVEFGASALVLVLLLFGLIDLGRVFYFDVGLQGAAREGARQASWFDPDTGTNPFLYDTAIKSAVDGILTKSGLPNSVLQNPGATCPATSDGNAAFNPPYSDSTYPATINSPLLYICYANTPGLDLASAPADNSLHRSSSSCCSESWISAGSSIRTRRSTRPSTRARGWRSVTRPCCPPTSTCRLRCANTPWTFPSPTRARTDRSPRPRRRPTGAGSTSRSQTQRRWSRSRICSAWRS
ncbi:MAG: pilus assembly protein [Chloroflexi bacterium]|nr:MAG: pilus assembly protein [Chloroflexota bacterium]